MLVLYIPEEVLGSGGGGAGIGSDDDERQYYCGYVCKCVCIYVFTQVRVISISISISISIPSLPYLLSLPQSSYYQQKKSKLHRSPFLILPPSPARACAYVCVYMNLWKDSPPCPVLFELRPVRPPPSPPRKKRRSLRRLPSLPPPM